jgi:hypothetical protein
MQRYNPVDVPMPNGLIRELLKPRDLVPEGIGYAQWEKLGEKYIGALLPD